MLRGKSSVLLIDLLIKTKIMIEISFYLNLQGNKYHKSTLATGRTFGGETEVSSFHSGGCGELESLHHNVMLGGGCYQRWNLCLSLAENNWEYSRFFEQDEAQNLGRLSPKAVPDIIYIFCHSRLILFHNGMVLHCLLTVLITEECPFCRSLRYRKRVHITLSLFAILHS